MPESNENPPAKKGLSFKGTVLLLFFISLAIITMCAVFALFTNDFLHEFLTMLEMMFWVFAFTGVAMAAWSIFIKIIKRVFPGDFDTAEQAGASLARIVKLVLIGVAIWCVYEWLT